MIEPVKGSLELGKVSEYVNEYAPGLLAAVARSNTRKDLPLSEYPGFDLWHCFEVEHLDEKGKPVHSEVTIAYPSTTDLIVESKSLKLYIGSFANTRIHPYAILHVIKKDLSQLLDTPYVCVYPIDETQFTSFTFGIQNCVFKWDAFRSRCKVTGQPDTAMVFLYMRNHDIFKYSNDSETLLAFLGKFREQQDFHESCIDEIYCHLSKMYDSFLVLGAFRRRGGIAITPIRNHNYHNSDFDILDDEYLRSVLVGQ